MKKIILFTFILIPFLLNAQTYITFKYQYIGFGQYTEVKNDVRKLEWSKGGGTVEINLYNNTIRIGTRKFRITEKKETIDGYTFKCVDFGNEDCKISYNSSNDGNTKIISILQNGIMFSYINNLR